MTTSTAPWVSAVSSQSDLQAAIEEILLRVKSYHDINAFHSVIFFVSSAYEAAAFSYDLIAEGISTHAPNIKNIIGCTTGGVIGAEDPTVSQKPSEIENRAALSVLLLKGDFQTQVTYYDPGSVEDLANREVLASTNATTGISFILATESTKAHLTRFMDQLSALDGISDCFGGLASSVSSYHKPKVFTSSAEDAKRLERRSEGLIVLTLQGKIGANFFIAKSCVPIGPLFEISSTVGNEILSLRRYNSSTIAEDALPPLVQLERILQECSSTGKYWLTRELIFSCVQKSPNELFQSGHGSVQTERDFFSQRASAFNPYSGSITAPSQPAQGGTFQFCVRNSLTTKLSVLNSQKELSKYLSLSNSPPLAALMINAVDRGSKSFKYQSWESLQVYFTLKDTEFDIPVVGMFSSGAFARLALSSSKTSACITEADTVFGVISEESLPYSSRDIDEDEMLQSLDMMTDFELKHFSDENDTIIVDKTAEVSNTVRVAGLDYFVPDKMPQARFVLEDLVWVRLKDADRMKERFPMKRALTQAKVGFLIFYDFVDDIYRRSLRVNFLKGI